MTADAARASERERLLALIAAAEHWNETDRCFDLDAEEAADSILNAGFGDVAQARADALKDRGDAYGRALDTLARAAWSRYAPRTPNANGGGA